MKITNCQHAPCGKPFPAGSDWRKRYCNDACRKAHNRAERAAQTGKLATVHPIAVKPADDNTAALADDVAELWTAYVAQLRTDGLMVAGTAGVPVAHPLLRSFSALYNAAREQLGAAPAEDDSDDDKILAAAMRRVAAIQAEESARYGY